MTQMFKSANKDFKTTTKITLKEIEENMCSMNKKI